MAEGLNAPRPRKPLKDQPRLIPESMSEQPKPEPYLAEMSLKRGIKHPVYTKVKLYPTPDEDDPRPFIAKDSGGNEVELDLKEQAMAEIIVLGKPRAETMDMINSQSSSPSYRKKFAGK